MQNKPVIYWDSMMFLYRINKNPNMIDILEHITHDAEDGNVLIVTSVFTCAEVAKVENCATTEEQERIISDFFENDFIRLIPVTREIVKKSREIVRLGGKIQGKDAVHIATACLTPRVQILHTYDTHMLAKSGKIPDSDLIIEEPKWNYVPDLTYKRPLGIFENTENE